MQDRLGKVQNEIAKLEKKIKELHKKKNENELKIEQSTRDAHELKDKIQLEETTLKKEQ